MPKQPDSNENKPDTTTTNQNKPGNNNLDSPVDKKPGVDYYSTVTKEDSKRMDDLLGISKPRQVAEKKKAKAKADDDTGDDEEDLEVLEEDEEEDDVDEEDTDEEEDEDQEEEEDDEDEDKEEVEEEEKPKGKKKKTNATNKLLREMQAELRESNRINKALTARLLGQKDEELPVVEGDDDKDTNIDDIELPDIEVTDEIFNDAVSTPEGLKKFGTSVQAATVKAMKQATQKLVRQGIRSELSDRAEKGRVVSSWTTKNKRFVEQYGSDFQEVVTAYEDKHGDIPSANLTKVLDSARDYILEQAKKFGGKKGEGKPDKDGKKPEVDKKKTPGFKPTSGGGSRRTDTNKDKNKNKSDADTLLGSKPKFGSMF